MTAEIIIGAVEIATAFALFYLATTLKGNAVTEAFNAALAAMVSKFTDEVNAKQAETNAADAKAADLQAQLDAANADKAAALAAQDAEATAAIVAATPQ